MPGGVSLYDYQEAALKKMKNGCILNGSVGSGKSRTGLAYYYTLCGGKVNTEYYFKMNAPLNLFIITTAKKRDNKEWDDELRPFGLKNPNYDNFYGYKNTVVVDSWNNIAKWKDVKNAFFIFDEQRVVGKGAWVKSFFSIVQHNKWILLSATPGDTWEDYIPVFIANGFYRNRTEFERQHCVFNPFVQWKSIQRYVNEGRLIKYRNDILVEMSDRRTTKRHIIRIPVDYNKKDYRTVKDLRWNIYENKPIENVSEYYQCMRRVVNSDITRENALLEILRQHKKAIVFYTFDYELDIIRDVLNGCNYVIGEWNGHKHENVPTGLKWAYIVEYIAGSEAWNCITTDTMVFWSLSYSWKMMEQARGRIDRVNTPFTDLYYYELVSKAPVDIRIDNALKRKKVFNGKKEYKDEFERLCDKVKYDADDIDILKEKVNNEKNNILKSTNER